MAIQWADDFTRYGTGSSSRLRMLEGLPYASIEEGPAGKGTVTADPDPNIVGGRAMKIEGGAAGLITGMFRLALPTPVAAETIGICWRGWLEELPLNSPSRPTLFSLLDNGPTHIIRVIVNANGSISVFGLVGGVQTEVFGTLTPIVTPSAWNHYELVHDNATGSGTLYINGVSRATWTGVDTGRTITLINASANQSLPSNASDYWIKDLVVWDGTGSENNSVMGTVIVRRIVPDGDVSLGDWTPSTGTTGFNLLNGTAPDDTTFLSAADTPMPSDVMQFTMTNLPPDITSVRGLVPVIRVRKIDGGDATIQAGVSPNGTDWDDGADRPTTTAFTYYFDVSELNPDTGTAWTPATVDSSETRIDRTS